MDLLDPNLLFVGITITAVMFAVVAFFSRASLLRIIGVLLAAIPVMPMVVVYDKIAAQLGWWHYPAVTTADAPLAWYGAALGLIGWRVIRRWRTPGLVALPCLV